MLPEAMAKIGSAIPRVCDECRAAKRAKRKDACLYPTASDFNMDADALHRFGAMGHAYMDGYVSKCGGCNEAYWDTPYELADLAACSVPLEWRDTDTVEFDAVNLMEELDQQSQMLRDSQPTLHAKAGPAIMIHAYAIARGILEARCDTLACEEGGLR